jgi:hypothetical protein
MVLSGALWLWKSDPSGDMILQNARWVVLTASAIEVGEALGVY